ncbi:MAG TPA: hypothetical protein VHL31_11550 [Geminicoccus sp.]|jgi:hypothetical protein|uniref:hypothetical protein n=1 Tax=Geminicoccus sp. TaxID=2024832 RepID=UPI002E31ECC3|nr:hypothetical protein [Geminicoccus sp.]HEX2526914.1 hypothetical protein [Geminicoccus sp.]
MRRRPPKPVIDEALLREGQRRSDDLIEEVALSLRDADRLDADLQVRLVALKTAAVRAAGCVPDLQMAALAAAREAAERAAGEEGCSLLERVRCGDWMVGQVARDFHTPTLPIKPH